MASLAQVREEIAAKRQYLERIMGEAGDDLDFSKIVSINGDTHQKVAEVRRMNEELNSLGAQLDELTVAEQIFKANRREIEIAERPSEPFQHAGSRHQPATELARKGLRGYLADHKGYAAFRQGKAGRFDISIPVQDFKTLISVSSAAPQADRRALVNMGVEDRTIADLCLDGSMDGAQIDYYEETTFDPMDAETVSEGNTKPEATIAYTLRTETARKVAVTIPATKESLDDISWMESQLRGRLAFAVRRREENQILKGDGNAPNLRGIVNRTNVQTQAKGADPTPDAIYKAMQKVRGAAGLGFAEPTGVVMHPNDWTDIKLLRTVDGIYIWGNPSDEGPDRIWGLMVRQTTEMTEHTALVGAFRPYAEVLRREGVSVTISTEHADFFVDNKVMILAESRLALAVYRPQAFCLCTGI